MKSIIVPILFLVSFGVSIEVTTAQDLLTVEILPLAPGWSGGQCGNFSRAIADKLAVTGGSNSQTNFINTNPLQQRGGHAFLLYQNSNGSRFLIDGTFSQYNGGRGTGNRYDVASALCGTPEGQRIYRGLNDHGFVPVRQGTIEAYTQAITEGRAQLGYDELLDSDANQKVCLGPQKNKNMEVLRQRSLEPSADYANRHVRSRANGCGRPIVDVESLLGPSCAKTRSPTSLKVAGRSAALCGKAARGALKTLTFDPVEAAASRIMMRLPCGSPAMAGGLAMAADLSLDTISNGFGEQNQAAVEWGRSGEHGAVPSFAVNPQGPDQQFLNDLASGQIKAIARRKTERYFGKPYSQITRAEIEELEWMAKAQKKGWITGFSYWMARGLGLTAKCR